MSSLTEKIRVFSSPVLYIEKFKMFSSFVDLNVRNSPPQAANSDVPDVATILSHDLSWLTIWLTYLYTSLRSEKGFIIFILPNMGRGLILTILSRFSIRVIGP